MRAWHAAFCKPRGESRAAQNLANQKFEVYFPRMLTRRRRAGRWVDLIEPLFPRYLFLRASELSQSLAPVRSTIGVVGLVSFSGTPAIVPDHMIDALRLLENPESGMHVSDELYRDGDRVRFVEGPFSGLEGVFGGRCGDDRVFVLLEMLGKFSSLKVCRDWLVPAA